MEDKKEDAAEEKDPDPEVPLSDEEVEQLKSLLERCMHQVKVTARLDNDKTVGRIAEMHYPDMFQLKTHTVQIAAEKKGVTLLVACSLFGKTAFLKNPYVKYLECQIELNVVSTDELEESRIMISNHVELLNVSSSHADIINLRLRRIEERFGAKEVNRAIEEFGLDQRGWKKI